MTYPDRLSPRQEEIVELVVVDGLTYSEVAEKLGLSKYTVRAYAEKIGRRMGTQPRLAMAQYYWTIMAPVGVA